MLMRDIPGFRSPVSGASARTLHHWSVVYAFLTGRDTIPVISMVRLKICFSCNSDITGTPKISRRDNKTEICSQCAEYEALRELFLQSVHRPTEAAQKTLFQILSF